MRKARIEKEGKEAGTEEAEEREKEEGSGEDRMSSLCNCFRWLLRGASKSFPGFLTAANS